MDRAFQRPILAGSPSGSRGSKAPATLKATVSASAWLTLSRSCMAAVSSSRMRNPGYRRRLSCRKRRIAKPTRQRSRSQQNDRPGTPARRVDQGARGHAGILDHQDSRNHARRDRRRYGDHDLARRTVREPGAKRLSDRHRHFRASPGWPGLGADQGTRLQPLALLGDDRRFDHLRHDAGRFRRSLARYRLSRRLAPAPRLRARLTVRLVSDPRDGRREHGVGSARRNLLLDHHHFLADSRHCARRLDRRRGARLFRRRAGVRRRSRCSGDPLFHDEREPRPVVLGRLYPDSPARRDGRRFPRQAARQGWAGNEPTDCIGGPRCRDYRADHDPPAAAGKSPRKGGRTRVKLRRGLVALTLAGAAAPAFAGPPYLTDDPVPTDSGHWEIYGFAAGEGRHATLDADAGFDLNYGPVKGVQLTATLPLSFSHAPVEGWRSGTGDLEVGVEYRLFEDESHGLSAAIFPRAILPTAGHSPGEKTRFLLPLWVGKDFAGGASPFRGRG